MVEQGQERVQDRHDQGSSFAYLDLSINERDPCAVLP